MSALLALALCLLQDPAAPVERPPGAGAPERSARWWGQLDEAQRNEFRQRFEQYKQLPPEAQEALRKRVTALHAEREQMIAGMSDSERDTLAAMEPEVREHVLRDMLRARLSEKKQQLSEEMPGADQALRGRPFHERVRESGRLLEEMHRPRVLEQLRKAGDAGWLGPHALSWFEKAPLEHAYDALGHVRKWQVIEEMSQDGTIERLGLDEQEQRGLFALPPHEFARVVRRVRAGATKEQALRSDDFSDRDGDWGAWRHHRGRGERGDRPPGEAGGEGPPERRPERGDGERGPRSWR
ncbi:MAG TPA: DUF3106 domain-containing protein [Planctomycetota bacterium]